jgi:hypothetical protein
VRGRYGGTRETTDPLEGQVQRYRRAH